MSFFRSGRLKSCALCAPVRGRWGRCCWRGRRRGAGRLGRLCCLAPRWPCACCCCCRCWRGCCCCLATLCCCCCFCCCASFLFLRFLLFLTASLTTATSSNTNRISLSFMISDFSSASFLWKKTRSQVNVLCLFQLVTLAAVLLMLKRTGGPRPGNPLYMSSYIRTSVGQFWHRLDEKWSCNQYSEKDPIIKAALCWWTLGTCVYSPCLKAIVSYRFLIVECESSSRRFAFNNEKIIVWAFLIEKHCFTSMSKLSPTLARTYAQ